MDFVPAALPSVLNNSSKPMDWERATYSKPHGGCCPSLLAIIGMAQSHWRGCGLCSASGGAEIPPCPQQVNGLRKPISPGKCCLIIASICSAHGRRGWVSPRPVRVLQRLHPLMSIIGLIPEWLRGNQWFCLPSPPQRCKVKPIKGKRHHRFPPDHIITKPQSKRQRAATALS